MGVHKKQKPKATVRLTMSTEKLLITFLEVRQEEVYRNG